MGVLKGQIGLSLVELTLTLAITGLIIVPLTAIFQGQLRLPARVSDEATASRQVQAASQVLVGDAQSALSFTPGADPEYGTFYWVDQSSGEPKEVTSRYFFQGQSVFRELTRGDFETTPLRVISEVLAYDKVAFQAVDPSWAFDSETNNWVYTPGKVEVLIEQTREVGVESIFETTHNSFSAEFRPHTRRPLTAPVASSVMPSRVEH